MRYLPPPFMYVQLFTAALSRNRAIGWIPMQRDGISSRFWTDPTPLVMFWKILTRSWGCESPAPWLGYIFEGSPITSARSSDTGMTGCSTLLQDDGTACQCCSHRSHYSHCSHRWNQKSDRLTQSMSDKVTYELSWTAKNIPWTLKLLFCINFMLKSPLWQF